MFRCLLEDALAAFEAFADGVVVLEELEELELQAASMSAAVAMATPRRQCRDRNEVGGTARLLVQLSLGLIRDGPPRGCRFRQPSGGERCQVRSQGRPVAPFVWASRRCHGPVQR